MFKKTLIVILCLVCVTTFLHSQNAVKLINESETERIEKYLSSDQLAGRQIYTAGIEMAAKFIANEFKQNGLATFKNSDSHLQSFSRISTKFISAAGNFDGNNIDTKNIIAITSEPNVDINEKTYKVKSEKRFRGIAGLSMGGYGALLYGLKYPKLFAAAAPLSAVVWNNSDISTASDNIYNSLFAPADKKNIKGTDRINAAWLQNSPLQLIETKSVEELSSVKFWIDCGDDDYLSVGNANLHIAMTNKKIPHEFRVRDGAHSWTYWRTGVIDALAFIGNSFHQK